MKLQLLLLVQTLLVGYVASQESNTSTEVPLPEKAEENCDETDAEYQWPSVYELADDMLDASLLMYPIAELRRIAREHPEAFSDPQGVLKEPVTAKEVETILMTNAAVLQEYFQPETMEVMNEVMDTVIARNQVVRDTNNPSLATLVDFSDDNSNAALVYAIGKDDARKRVTVSFRGSVTKTDWKQDAQIWMERIPNPVVGKGQPNDVRIHHGFYEYLFYETTSKEKRADGTIMNKYERIIGQAADLLKKNPGYKLFVTGHSLGAALASVFAFMAATETHIPSPVMCVSIASPYVGGNNFRTAFQQLEKDGKLRYLRVANQRDLVTVGPFVALNGGMYKHVGVELKLDKGTHSLSYPTRDYGTYFQRTWRNSLFANLGTNPAKNHSPAEYNRRLTLTEVALKSVYMEDLYSGYMK